MAFGTMNQPENTKQNLQKKTLETSLDNVLIQRTKAFLFNLLHIVNTIFKFRMLYVLFIYIARCEGETDTDRGYNTTNTNEFQK